jgi:hypothetical protein
MLGMHMIPGSDGQCGPTNGPQCYDCKGFNKRSPPCMPRNKSVREKAATGAALTVLESPHPYQDNSDIYTTVHFPGASGYVIKFSSGYLVLYSNSLNNNS